MKPEKYKGLSLPFNNENIKILCRGAEKQSSSKAPLFVFSIKKKKYISSLYPITGYEGQFVFETKGIAYHLDVEESQITTTDMNSYLNYKYQYSINYQSQRDN